VTFLDPESIPADDRGFLLGDGLFETVRLYRGRPFRLEAHLLRMERGAKSLGVAVPRDLRSRIARALEGWGGAHGALRITLTRGSGAGLHPPRGREPRIALQIREWRPDPRWWTHGLRAHPAGVVSAAALTAGLKSLGYLERIQALEIARSRGGEEAILSNEHGEFVEGSASNLLVVEGRTILAPGATAGALPGITREVVLGLLGKDGFLVEERGVSRPALARASEVLLTSSLREVVPVIRVGEEAVGSGEPGPTFRIALDGLRAQVASELGLQPEEVASGAT